MIKQLYSYIGNYKKYVMLCVMFVMVDVVCELMMPLLMSKIVDEGIPSKDIYFIVKNGIFMVLLAAISIMAGGLNMKFSAEASQGFAANLRRALFDRVQAFSFSNIDKFSTASLVTRLTSDVTQMQNTLLMCLRMLLRAPLMLVCAIFFAVSINARLSVVIFIAVSLLIAGIFLVLRTAEQKFAEMQKKIDNLNGTVQENLTAIRAVKAFVRERYEKQKFKKSNDALTEAAINAGNLISLIMPLMMFVLNGATLIVIWFGGRMVAGDEMGAGSLISFISYLMHILMSIMIFSMIFILFARAEACAKRILEVVNTKIDITDNDDTDHKREINSPLVRKGKIEFRHVDFKYAEGGRNVLSDINFSIEPGEFVAIVGGTGSGKTTLVSLIPRLYDVTKGQVLIDGIDVREYSLKQLRDGIGMVLQKNVLFSGTIRENLMWGNENATQEDIEKAASYAQAHDFIISFPDGYDTRLGQGGVNVSGGQKQRLCIARALLKKPPILILDDSTSAIDTATEARIRKSFSENLKDTTVLIIAQRISSVKNADKIVVLDDGRVVGIGKHDELFENNRLYREICNSQQEGLVI
ncbi:MAG: ATP-binding cassette, subfamily multidrug efflux pump [Tepidanaerobacteraceae bacterium]|nr:ATP-binding cassette, subfamily multidrug efflux pump [Tepidanaerobacteraceae bacterium]